MPSMAAAVMPRPAAAISSCRFSMVMAMVTDSIPVFICEIVTDTIAVCICITMVIADTVVVLIRKAVIPAASV